MKTFAAFVLTLAWASILPVQAQTGSAAPAVAPAPAASVQTASAVPQRTVVQPQKTGRPQRGGARVRENKPLANTPANVATPTNPKPNPMASNPPQGQPAVSYAQAIKRQHHQRHDREWWKSRYTIIVLVTGRGYYYWDAGYWFPAYGYDPGIENFDYEGPIYTYGDLLPDQVIYNVQRALKELGYYAGPLTGSFSAATRAAIATFQEDNSLDVTGGIDAPTVEALGLS